MDSVQFLTCISFFSLDRIIIYWNELYDLHNLVGLPVGFIGPMMTVIGMVMVMGIGMVIMLTITITITITIMVMVLVMITITITKITIIITIITNILTG